MARRSRARVPGRSMAKVRWQKQRKMPRRTFRSLTSALKTFDSQPKVKRSMQSFWAGQQMASLSSGRSQRTRNTFPDKFEKSNYLGRNRKSNGGGEQRGSKFKYLTFRRASMRFRFESWRVEGEIPSHKQRTS